MPVPRSLDSESEPCKSPSPPCLREQLRQLSGRPAWPSKSWRGRREGLREEIERRLLEDVSISTDLWDGESRRDEVAEAKARTLQLQQRTLELLYKAERCDRCLAEEEEREREEARARELERLLEEVTEEEMPELPELPQLPASSKSEPSRRGSAQIEATKRLRDSVRTRMQRESEHILDGLPWEPCSSSPLGLHAAPAPIILEVNGVEDADPGGPAAAAGPHERGSSLSPLLQAAMQEPLSRCSTPSRANQSLLGPGLECTRRLRESVRNAMERQSPYIFDDIIREAATVSPLGATPPPGHTSPLRTLQTAPIPETPGAEDAEAAVLERATASTPLNTEYPQRGPTAKAEEGVRKSKIVRMKTEELNMPNTTSGIVPPPRGSSRLPGLTTPTSPLPPPDSPPSSRRQTRRADRSLPASSGRPTGRGRPTKLVDQKAAAQVAEQAPRRSSAESLENAGAGKRTSLLKSRATGSQLEVHLKGELMHEEKLDVPGLSSLVNSSVNVYADQESGGLTVEVVRTRWAMQPERFVRDLSKVEVEGIISWGGMEDQAPPAVYAWLCRLVVVVENPKGRLLIIKGYEEERRETSFDHIRNDLRGIFSSTQERVRLGAEIQEKVEVPPPKDHVVEEARKKTIADVALRIRMDPDVVEALYDWHSKMDWNGDGRIDYDELALALQQAFKAADRTPLRKEQAYHFWKELNSRAAAGETTVPFPQFAAWVVAKFPYISAMPAGEVRRFTHVACAISREEFQRRRSSNKGSRGSRASAAIPGGAGAEEKEGGALPQGVQ